MKFLATILLIFATGPLLAQGVVGGHAVLGAAPVGGGSSPHTFSAPISGGYSANHGTTEGTVATGAMSVTSGQFVACYVFGYYSGGAMGTLTVADGFSHTYSITPNSPSIVNYSGTGAAYIAYWYATVSEASEVVTASWTGSTSNTSISCNVFGVTGAGAVTLDTDMAGTGTTGTTIGTPTITPPSAGDLIAGFGVSENGISAIAQTCSPHVYTWVADPDGVGFWGDEAEYVLAATSAQAACFTQSSGHWDSMGAAFK